MNESVHLNPIVQLYFDSVKRRDVDALVSIFAEDAEILDVSRRIQGRVAIRNWALNEVIGGTYEVIDVERTSDDGQRVLLQFIPPGAGSGFRATYSFSMSSGKVIYANLQYA